MGAHDLGQPGPGCQSPHERAAPHIEVAVSQPGFLTDFGAAFDREREDVGRGQDLQVRYNQFDLAGRQLGVHRLGGPGHHLPADADRALDPQARQGFERWAPRVGHQLQQAARIEPRRVAEIHEQQAAVVALGGHPPGHPNALPHVGRSEVRCPGVVVTVYGERSGSLHVSAAG